MYMGFVKLFRKFKEWEWYKDNNAKVVFLHCLLTANHKKVKWRGIYIENGSFVTSYGHLAEQLNLTIAQVRVALNKLQKTNEITLKTTHHYTMIFVENWRYYQDVDAENSTPNDKAVAQQQHSNSKAVATNKNDNNEKNDKNERKKKRTVFKKPTIEEIDAYCKERKNKVNATLFHDHYESNGWLVGGKSKMKNWKAAVRTWEQNNYNIKKSSKDKSDVNVEWINEYL